MMEIAIESVIATAFLYHWYEVILGGILILAVSVTEVSPPSQQNSSSPVTSMVGLLGMATKVPITSSLCGRHIPTASVVKVRVNDPLLISLDPGVYVAFRRFGLSKLPSPAVVHVVLVAVPPIEPFKVTSEPSQISKSVPASAKGPSIISR